MRNRTLVLSVFLALHLSAPQGQAQFKPPRIVQIVHADPSIVAEGVPDRTYYMDRGVEANIKVGDALNVYREKEVRLGPGVTRSLRVFLGTMNIRASQDRLSVGDFSPDNAMETNPLLRFKTAMKGDTVIPKLKIDSSVLFAPGSADLANNVTAELDKVAKFVESFSPSKLVIEGHTDSDGDAASNQKLSQARANAIRAALITQYAEIFTAEMIQVEGHGETRPLVSNDTPENKALNRRIELVVWE